MEKIKNKIEKKSLSTHIKSTLKSIKNFLTKIKVFLLPIIRSIHNRIRNFDLTTTLERKKVQDWIFRLFLLIAIIVILAQPASSPSAKTFFVFSVVLMICYFCLMALALNVQTGMAGVVNFGVIFFVGIGMVVTGILSVRLGVDPILSMVIAMIISGIIGYLLAYPGLRLRADYFAIITLALGQVLKALMLAEHYFQTYYSLGGLEYFSAGIVGIPKPFSSNYLQFMYYIVLIYNALTNFLNKIITYINFIPSIDIPLRETVVVQQFGYTVFLAIFSIFLLFLVYYFSTLLQNSPYGRVLSAIREDEEIVATYGYNVFQYKAVALGIGGALFAIPGAIWVWWIGSVFPETIAVTTTFFVWGAFIIGGKGNTKGMIVGGIIIALTLTLVAKINEARQLGQSPGWLQLIDGIFKFIVVDIGGRYLGDSTWVNTFRNEDNVVINLNFTQILLVGVIIIFFLRYMRKGLLPELPYRPTYFKKQKGRLNKK
jgi:neutral amino acid transport system permease protein